MSALNEQANEWIQWLVDSGKSEAFVRNSISTMRQFASQFDEMTEANINKFLLGKNPTTANSYLARIQSFCKYHRISIHRVVRRPEDKDEPIALNSNQLRLLISTAQASEPEMAHVIIVLSETGLRVHEFLQLEPDSLMHLEDGTPAVRVRGKGRVKRTVPLTQVCLEAFQSIKFPIGKQQQAICRSITRLGEQAGIGIPITTHTLRRSFASIALNAKGMPLQDVMRVGGWSNPTNLIKHYYKADMGRIVQGMNSR